MVCCSNWILLKDLTFFAENEILLVFIGSDWWSISDCSGSEYQGILQNHGLGNFSCFYRKLLDVSGKRPILWKTCRVVNKLSCWLNKTLFHCWSCEKVSKWVLVVKEVEIFDTKHYMECQEKKIFSRKKRRTTIVSLLFLLFFFFFFFVLIPRYNCTVNSTISFFSAVKNLSSFWVSEIIRNFWSDWSTI